ncbi:hypothetical protein LTR08_004339 [Meristemomyces frigidus]|nr:hypothetical protein LTR08_004339 [Meristemomyces frigidus]
MATDLCHPILKYSHATGVRSDSSIPWSHLQAEDLFIILKGIDTHYPDGRLHLDGKLSMRIVDGTNALETVDLAHYIDLSIDARRGAEQVGVTPQIEQLPIFGITKEALLALRYRLDDGQARRLQLRMKDATDCRRIVTALANRGMEFQEQRPGTARPGSGRPITNNSQHRPPTAQSNSPYFDPSKSVARPSPFTQPEVEAGSLSRRQPPVHERFPTRGPEQPVMQSQEMAPPPLFSRDEITAPRMAVPTRPTTAEIYRSYTTLPQPSQYDAVDVLRRPSDPTGERPSSTSHVSTLEAIREAVEEDATSPRTATYMPPPLHTSIPNEHWSSATAETLPLTTLSSDPLEQRPSTGRPSTSATTPVPDTQEFNIPPRRELPFKRPDSKHSGSDRSVSRPRTSALTMPPLPKPNLNREGSGSTVRADSASPTKQGLGSRPGTASPLKRTFNATEEEPTRPQTSGAQPSNTRPLAPREPSPLRQAALAEQPGSPTMGRKPTRMDELLYGRRPPEERSPNKVPRLNSLNDAPHENVTPPTSPKRIALADGSHDPTINAYTALRSSAHDSRETSLEEYATQSLQDRQTALDEFMIENLENPAFTKLCEDVENCWRRIALGL